MKAAAHSQIAEWEEDEHINLVTWEMKHQIFVVWIKILYKGRGWDFKEQSMKQKATIVIFLSLSAFFGCL